MTVNECVGVLKYIFLNIKNKNIKRPGSKVTGSCINDHLCIIWSLPQEVFKREKHTLLRRSQTKVLDTPGSFLAGEQSQRTTCVSSETTRWSSRYLEEKYNLLFALPSRGS